MRKVIAIVLILCICFTACACGGAKEPAVDTIEEPSIDTSVQDAVAQYLTGNWGSTLNEAINTLLERRTTLNKLDDAQLETLFGHHYFTISSPTAHWYIFDYSSDKGIQQLEYFMNHNGMWSVEIQSYAKRDAAIADSTLLYNDATYEIYSVMDGIFVSYKVEANGEYIVDSVMFEWEEPVKTLNELDAMVNTLNEKLSQGQLG